MIKIYGEVDNYAVYCIGVKPLKNSIYAMTKE